MGWRLRSCPRCGGDLYRDTAMRQQEEECLQCGHRVAVGAVVDTRVGSVHWERMTVKGERRGAA